MDISWDQGLSRDAVAMTANLSNNVTATAFDDWSHPLVATEVTYATRFPMHASPSCPPDDSSLRVPLAILYSVFFVLGLAGNILALWVFHHVHDKKNSVRVLLIHTALADLLLVICLPFRVYYHSNGNHWELGSTFCNVVGNLFYMNMYISITLLGLISVNRYLKILQGRAVALLTNRWSSALCGIIWRLALVGVLPMILLGDGNQETSSRCFQYQQRQQAKWKAYFNLFLVGVFWIVFVCLVVSYRKIALKLLRTSRNKPDLPNALHYNRTAKKSFFVLFLFTICFVPYHIVRVFYIVSQVTDTSCFWRGVADKANEVVLLLSALNSCLDPVMYFLLSASVRKKTLRLLNNVLHQRDSGGSGSASSAGCGRMLVEEPNVCFVSDVRNKPVG